MHLLVWHVQPPPPPAVYTTAISQQNVLSTQQIYLLLSDAHRSLKLIVLFPQLMYTEHVNRLCLVCLFTSSCMHSLARLYVSALALAVKRERGPVACNNKSPCAHDLDVCGVHACHPVPLATTVVVVACARVCARVKESRQSGRRAGVQLAAPSTTQTFACTWRVSRRYTSTTHKRCLF